MSWKLSWDVVKWKLSRPRTGYLMHSHLYENKECIHWEKHIHLIRKLAEKYKKLLILVALKDGYWECDARCICPNIILNFSYICTLFKNYILNINVNINMLIYHMCITLLYWGVNHIASVNKICIVESASSFLYQRVSFPLLIICIPLELLQVTFLLDCTLTCLSLSCP